MEQEQGVRLVLGELSKDTHELCKVLAALVAVDASHDELSTQVAPEALARKDELLELSESVTAVTSNDQSADAQRVSRSLAALRIETDKYRKLIKEPVNKIGKLIDTTAADFIAEVTAEENRIKRLVGDHATEMAKAAAAAAAEERRLADEARRAREASEAAAEAAKATGTIADVIAAKQAEAARQTALGARMDAAEETAQTKVAGGVRFAVDFEVTDAARMFAKKPELVTLTVARMETLAWLKALDEQDVDITEIGELYGIRAFKKAVVSSK